MFTHRRTLMALSISLLSLSVACTPKANHATLGDLQDSVVANAVATSESDWHSSPATPEKIFAKWNGDLIQKKITSDEVCSGLAQVADKDLALFEEEIRAPRNAVLLSACLEQVTARLD